MTGNTDIDKAAWDALFHIQYDLCAEIDKLITDATKGKPGDWQTIVALYVVEHLGERARFWIEPSAVPVPQPEEGLDP